MNAAVLILEDLALADPEPESQQRQLANELARTRRLQMFRRALRGHLGAPEQLVAAGGRELLQRGARFDDEVMPLALWGELFDLAVDLA